MAEVKKMSYKGKEIFYCDNKGLQGVEATENYKKIMEMIKKSEQTEILTLTDMTGVVITDEVNKKMKEFGQEVKKITKNITKKGAILGMAEGPKKVIVNMFIRFSGMNLKLFDDIDEAKEWLVR